MYMPVRGARITARFNQRGRLWRTGRHGGLDFAAPTGSKIYSIGSGKVVSTGYQGAYGNVTLVRMDDGTTVRYAHQSRFDARPGQRVQRGSLIGRVGSTGNSTGPHLHLEVRRNGKGLNPENFLRGESRYDTGGGIGSRAGGGGASGAKSTPLSAVLGAVNAATKVATGAREIQRARQMARGNPMGSTQPQQMQQPVQLMANPIGAQVTPEVRMYNQGDGTPGGGYQGASGVNLDDNNNDGQLLGGPSLISEEAVNG